MRRASRGRLVVPMSCSDVEGKDGFAEAVALVPLSCKACCELCVLGCVEDAVGGLGLAAPLAVVGGVDMPFGISAAAGEAIVRIWGSGGCERRWSLRCGLRSDLRASESLGAWLANSEVTCESRDKEGLWNDCWKVLFIKCRRHIPYVVSYPCLLR